jgi:type II secretory pathway predicted ATPase ExeA
MKDLLAWFGLKHFPFDKNIKTQDVFPTDSLKECSARLEYIKRRGGILLLTGDPGVGKTLALRRYVDSLNENLFKPFYTPLSTLSRADLLYHINRLLGLTPRLSKSAIYTQIQRAFLESKETSGKTILLMIDEAHLLQTGPLEELRLLTIAHHMTLAGAKEPILDEQALQAVHELSFGIPRKIGAITEQALTYAMFDQKRTVTPEMVLRVKNLEG